MDSEPSTSPRERSAEDHGSRALAVSAVVVNHNGGDRLSRCLEALLHQEFPLETILVVDSGSTDGSPSAIAGEFPEVRVVELGANLGPSVSRNTGLERLDTPLVLCVDSDIYLEPGCLGRMLEAYRQFRPAVVCPRVVLYPETDHVHCDGGGYHFVGTLALEHGFQPVAAVPPGPVGAVGAAISACLLIDRTLALAAGGFDELYFFYFEDLEFSLKLRIRGHTIVCDPAAVALHDRGQGTPGLAFRGRGRYPYRRAYYSMRNRWITLLTYLRWRTLLLLWPVLISYEVATLALALVRGCLGAWPRSWWWLLTHPRQIWARRQRAQGSRVAPDSDLLEGGPLPLAPGLLRSRLGRALIGMYSSSLNGYWRLIRRWIG